MKKIVVGEGAPHPMLSPTPPTKVKKGKIVSAEEAIKVIRDGDTIATGGVAPGIDVKKDILPWMDFQSAIKEPVRLMDERIFKDEPMGLKEDLLALSGA